jgi:hypothetical protein
MLRSCIYLAALAVSISTFASAHRASGQDMVLSQMYGSGVHAYFSGDYPQAIEELKSAIDAGSKDPRTYYFRGLAALRMGMTDSAEEDFKSGAGLEAKTLERFYPVSRSLERIQGTDRVVLEKHRAQARAIAYQDKQKKEQARYERLRRAEETVLRSTPTAQPLPAPTPAPSVPIAAPAPPAADDPFGEAPAAPAAPVAPAEDDPFGETPPPATPAPAPPAAAEEDPFGAPAPAPTPGPPADDEDPFADDAPPAEKPADAPPAADDDPFAG